MSISTYKRWMKEAYLYEADDEKGKHDSGDTWKTASGKHAGKYKFKVDYFDDPEDAKDYAKYGPSGMSDDDKEKPDEPEAEPKKTAISTTGGLGGDDDYDPADDPFQHGPGGPRSHMANQPDPDYKPEPEAEPSGEPEAEPSGEEPSGLGSDEKEGLNKRVRDAFNKEQSDEEFASNLETMSDAEFKEAQRLAQLDSQWDMERQMYDDPRSTSYMGGAPSQDQLDQHAAQSKAISSEKKRREGGEEPKDEPKKKKGFFSKMLGKKEPSGEPEGGEEVERDNAGVPENEADWAEEIDQVQSNYEEMKDNYEQSRQDGDPDDPEEKEQMDLDRVEYRKAEDKLRKYKKKEKEQGWDREMGRTGTEEIKVINGKKYRAIKESVDKRISVKEVHKWLKGLEEYRYRKIPGVDARRITSFVNNGLNETDLPKSLQKKWESARYNKEKSLADRFIKQRISQKLTQTESKKHPLKEQYDRLFTNRTVL